MLFGGALPVYGGVLLALFVAGLGNLSCESNPTGCTNINSIKEVVLVAAGLFPAAWLLADRYTRS